MAFETKKKINSSVFSSSISVVISLSLVLFIVGTLFLVLINAQKLSNYVKENIGFMDSIPIIKDLPPLVKFGNQLL